MGFYNILRIVKSVLYRTPKKILISVIIGLVLFMFNSHVFGAQVVSWSEVDSEGVMNYYGDCEQRLRNYQLEKQNKFIDLAIANYSQDNLPAVTKIFNEFKNLGSHGKCIQVSSSSNNEDSQSFWVNFVFLNTLTFHANANLEYNFFNSKIRYHDVQIMSGTLYGVVTAYSEKTPVLFEATFTRDSDYISYDELNVCSTRWIELFKTYGLIKSTSEENDLLQQILNSTNENKDQLANVNNNLSNIDNSINDMNNTITDSTVNAPINDLPKDNTQDITDGGFNQIFELLRTTFTTSEPKDLVVQLPFVNKSFTINSANVYGNADLGIVKVLIQSFWYFVFCYFIVKDISIKINKLKSGNIEDVQTDNVKEDIL